VDGVSAAAASSGPFARLPDQTGFVVDDLEAAVALWSTVLGIKGWVGFRYDSAYVPHRTFRGHPQNDSVTRNAVSEGGRIGLVQPVEGRSLFAEALESRGPGLHHLSYFVSSLEPGRRRLLAHDFSEVMTGSGHGLDGDGAYAYFESAVPIGFYIQLVVPPHRRAAPHFTFP